MTAPQTTNAGLKATLDRRPPNYEPGDTVRLEAEANLGSELLLVELSIVWCTVGKGDEDLVVHDFRRLNKSDLSELVATGQPLALETVLPASPLSYAGRSVKVCWSARVRGQVEGGRRVMSEAPFRLGNVAPPPAAASDGSDGSRERSR